MIVGGEIDGTGAGAGSTATAGTGRHPATTRLSAAQCPRRRSRASRGAGTSEGKAMQRRFDGVTPYGRIRAASSRGEGFDIADRFSRAGLRRGSVATLPVCDAQSTTSSPRRTVRNRSEGTCPVTAGGSGEVRRATQTAVLVPEQALDARSQIIRPKPQALKQVRRTCGRSTASDGDRRETGLDSLASLRLTSSMWTMRRANPA